MDWGILEASALSAAAALVGKKFAADLWNRMKGSSSKTEEHKLFPNGERLQIVRAIKDLKLENEQRRDEIQGMRRIVDKIAAHLKIEVLE